MVQPNELVNNKKLRNLLIISGIVVIVLFLFVLGFYIFRHSIFNHKEVLSNYDNNYYDVHNNFRDKQKAANALAIMNDKIINLMRHMKRKYDVDGVNTMEDDIIWRLCRNYNSDQLVENSPYNIEGSTSYTKNKGEKIAICLRNSKTGKIHDMNLLMFVVLHELSHVACDQYGHPEKFWDIFRFILREAIETGTWKYVDYKKHPQYYCRMMITDTPIDIS